MIKNITQYQSSYALAIYQLFLEVKADLISELTTAKIWLEAFKQWPEIINLLNAYELSHQTKTQILNKLCNQKFVNKQTFDIWLNAFELLIKKRHRHLINGFLSHLIEMLNQVLNIKTGIIYSTIELSQLQVKTLTEQVQEYFQEKVELSQMIDVSLIGGFKIIIDSQEFNQSIKNQLSLLKRKLLNSDWKVESEIF